MRWITQTLAVMALNLRTIPARLGSSSVVAATPDRIAASA